VVGVAPVGLVEDLVDDGGGVIDDARDAPLVGRRGCWGLVGAVVSSGEDVARRSGDRRDVVDAPDLGHSFTVLLLSARQARLELVMLCGSGLGRLFAQGAGSHHDPLAIGGEHQNVAGPALEQRRAS